MNQETFLGPIFVGERVNWDEGRKNTKREVFISSHQTLLRWYLRRTWTHGCSGISDWRWVLKLGGRTEGFCSGFTADSALIIGLIRLVGIAVLWWTLCSPSKLQMWGFSSCVSSSFGLLCSFQAAWPECPINVEWGQGAGQRAGLLGTAYTVLCDIYCFVRTWNKTGLPISVLLKNSGDCLVLLVLINK